MKRNFATLRIGKRRFSVTLQDVIVFKVIIMVGLTAAYFLPGHLAAPVTVATNLLWLWRV